MTNLEKPRDGGEDELALLRARAGADPPGREAGVEGGARPHQKTGEDGGAQKKKKKKRDKKSKKRRKRASEEEKDASSDEEIRLDDTQNQCFWDLRMKQCRWSDECFAPGKEECLRAQCSWRKVCTPQARFQERNRFMKSREHSICSLT